MLLRDGRYVDVRPICPGDADGVLDLHARLSPESRRSRFFTASTTKRRLDVERLTEGGGRYDCVLVAVEPSEEVAAEGAAEPGVQRDGAQIVGLAQLVDSPSGVEAALVVRDDYQGVGLGSELFRELLRMGDARGIRNVQASVLSGNNRILRILREHDATLGPTESGITHATIRRAS